MRLLHIDDTPIYVRDNEHIKLGYRPQLTPLKALASAFSIHNETLNIWTHAIAAIAFLYFYFQDETSAAMCVFLICATTLFATSTFYHTFLCVSKMAHDTWRKLDFTCIGILMFSMFLPFCTFTFSPSVAYAYISAAFVISAAAIGVAYLPQFDKNEFHIYRPLVFGSIGILGAIVLLHGIQSIPDVRVGILCGLQLALCFIGGMFYAFKWPEKYIPNKPWTSFTSSHVLFHVCVALGIFCFYVANSILFNIQKR